MKMVFAGALAGILAASAAVAADAPAVPNPVNATAVPLDPTTCDNRPVIMVVSGVIHDRARLGAYARAIRESGLYVALGGYYLNNPRPVAQFEGEAVANASTLLVRFPCLAHARAFWYSKVYQEKIVPLRSNPPAGTFTVTVYEENALPAYMQGRVAAGTYSAAQPASVNAGIEKTPAFGVK